MDVDVYQIVILQLCMIDVIFSVLFYQWFGFVVDWEYRFVDGMLLFVQISCVGQQVFFSEYVGDCELGGVVYFCVVDVDVVYVVFVVVGVLVLCVLVDMLWGGCEMMVVDLDNNWLWFVMMFVVELCSGL